MKIYLIQPAKWSPEASNQENEILGWVPPVPLLFNSMPPRIHTELTVQGIVHLLTQILFDDIDPKNIQTSELNFCF